MADMDFYGALGLDAPGENADAGDDRGEAEAETVTEAGEAAAENGEQGEEQEAAASAAGEGAKTDTRTEEQKAQDAQFASARRKAERERDEAVSKARAEAKAEAEEASRKAIEDMLSTIEISDPYSGERITTAAEYAAFRNRYSTEKTNNELKAAGISAETINELISKHPAVQEAQSIVNKAKSAESNAQAAEAKAKLEADIAEIGKMDASIKSLEDLSKHKDFQKIYDYTVKNGLSVADAYRLATENERISSAREAAKQEARNASAGKAHMVAMNSRGEGDADIPRAVEEMYRKLDPHATTAEIAKLYKKTR